MLYDILLLPLQVVRGIDKDSTPVKQTILRVMSVEFVKNNKDC